jgi:hypothetical protein
MANAQHQTGHMRCMAIHIFQHEIGVLANTEFSPHLLAVIKTAELHKHQVFQSCEK